MSIVILNIETATKVCSASLSIDGKIAHTQEINDSGYSHAENLALFIDNLLKQSKLDYSDLSAVAVSKGPGSYTGLRIGVSTAKGLCYALDIPLISVPTLEAMSAGFIIENTLLGDDLLCPMIDARRMEVYAALFGTTGKQIRKTQADIVDSTSYIPFLEKSNVYFFGDGASKCTEVFAGNSNAIVVEDFYPSAKYMTELSYQKFLKKEMEDVAYFEPYYLKDFIAGKPKKLV